MKLIKAMKHLKFWSKKNKRNKIHHQYYKLAHDQYNYNLTHPTYNPPPPPPRPPPPRLPQPSSSPPPLCQCHFCEPSEPSAPPLPSWASWVESSHDTYNDHSPWLESTHESYSGNCDSVNSVDPDSSEEHCVGIESEQEMPNAGVLVLKQQDMDPNLEESVPVNALVSGRQQPSRNPFGCVVEVGAFLFRCIIPCFRGSDHGTFQYSAASLKALPDTGSGKKIV